MDDAPTPRRRSRSRSKGRHSSENKPIRVWCPGSYDFLHYKQINFLRKVKHETSLRFPNVELVVGLYSDEDLISKGKRPVFSLAERYDMISANKWVDDVVKDAPLELSKSVLKMNSCDYAFCMEQGQDEENVITPEYDELKKDLEESGLLKKIPPSKDDFGSLCSSDLINRMLLREPRDENNNTPSGQTWKPEKLSFPFSFSCKEMLSFCSRKIPKLSDKVVYVDGSFDLLTPTHIKLLKKARSLGDFLYVGLHSDKDISKYAGKGFPIMKWNERLINLLSLRCVSEVIIDAPTKITDGLIKEFSINYVVSGLDDYGRGDDANENVNNYDVPKQRGVLVKFALDKERDGEKEVAAAATDAIYSEVRSTTDILKRVHENWHLYNHLLSGENLEIH